MSRFSLFLFLFVTLAFGTISVSAAKKLRARQAEHSPRTATAKIAGPNGVSGTVTFTCLTDMAAVRISGEIRGLTPGKHGFHVHQLGNTTDCAKMGGHFNPLKHNHGAPSDAVRHIGDLGNIEAGSNGIAKIDFMDDKIHLKGEQSIIGRGLVVHAKPDDLGKGGKEDSLKTGAAGARVGCATIRLKK